MALIEPTNPTSWWSSVQCDKPSKINFTYLDPKNYQRSGFSHSQVTSHKSQQVKAWKTTNANKHKSRPSPDEKWARWIWVLGSAFFFTKLLLGLNTFSKKCLSCGSSLHENLKEKVWSCGLEGIKKKKDFSSPILGFMGGLQMGLGSFQNR